MAPEKPDGFTLLELVVSLTILGVIITLIYGGMRIGVRAWERERAASKISSEAGSCSIASDSSWPRWRFPWTCRRRMPRNIF